MSLDPISPARAERLHDYGPCPESINGHRVNNRRGLCEWCGRKVAPNAAELAAIAQWWADKRLAKEPRNG